MQTNSSEGPAEEGLLILHRGLVLVVTAAPVHFKSSDALGIERADIREALLPLVLPAQIPPFHRGSQAPLLESSPLPIKVLGPLAGKECLLKG